MDNRARRRFSIFIAILLHAVVFFIYFDSPVPHTSHAYSIEITNVPAVNHSAGSASQTKEMRIIEKAHTKPLNNITESTFHEASPLVKAIEDVQPEEEEAPNSENGIIDSRSMYDVEDNQHKKTNAKLEMTGWEWDSVPKPRDTTDETGKIVFQIVIDGDGFVIGIKEIETTVSPQLASIYKESLAKLSFSKSTAGVVDEITTKGTVTFILNTK